MKAPNIKNLSDLVPDDHFTKTVEVEKDKARESVRKTFSLQQRDFDYIHDQALLLSQETGKVVSASSALRYIIQRDRSTGS